MRHWESSQARTGLLKLMSLCHPQKGQGKIRYSLIQDLNTLRLCLNASSSSQPACLRPQLVADTALPPSPAGEEKREASSDRFKSRVVHPWSDLRGNPRDMVLSLAQPGWQTGLWLAAGTSAGAHQC